MHRDEAFRIVVKRWKKEQLELFEGGAYRYHVIATNSGLSMEEVIRKYDEDIVMGDRGIFIFLKI
jgi:hypothetical protein